MAIKKKVVVKKAHGNTGKTKSSAHRKAISEALKRYHASKKKPSAARTKTGKLKTDKKTLANAHSKLDAMEKRAKERRAKAALKKWEPVKEVKQHKTSKSVQRSLNRTSHAMKKISKFVAKKASKDAKQSKSKKWVPLD